MALGSYEEILSRDDIDAIYLPLPTGLRPEWALKVVKAGKHLLCEKPCGTSLKQVQDIVAACDRAGVQFMDGVMFMHSERLKRVRAVIDDGATIGKLRRITQFSFGAPMSFLRKTLECIAILSCMAVLGIWGGIRSGLSFG